ncbi:hypothetical protein GCM10023189_55430 [Nibrella saemangeumensis]|uniref:Heparinase II/III-like protein n=1 Tax=Nibrella saemangeumensis TaxID=1084526 RepID=A0ABP8NPT3_9BACT
MKQALALLLFGLVTGSAPAQEFGAWNTPIPDFSSWWTPVRPFTPVTAGEHPRLLFRKQNLPALRRKAETPEGKAMLQRLRYLLDGGNGDGMPRAFNPARQAYAAGQGKSIVVDTAGVYTVGHVAGYGLLYQLTGDETYAELGRRCFELALQGQRDRDDRYSYVKPGGALRAGPVLGWLALGYDLCYDGWDKATTERLGKALAQYQAGITQKYGNKAVDLDALVSGTMPPKSNHYGMQVGGAALVLLALHKEPWVDQARIDSLLEVSGRSMVHAVTQGFGDGGYFAEGDGTGSMASHIVYLTALQAWRNAMGMDFVNTGRPNVRMTALKWIYLTVVREGKPEVWPIRGGYPHNVWGRTLSGAGYFSSAFGILPSEEQAAFSWFYNRFLLKPDTQAGAPYEPSVYPQFVVSAFVNWPVGLPERNPAEVLPLCYRDSVYGFYAWRNRWQDENDIVITALTKPARGYMGAKADTALHILAYSQHLTWGRLNSEARDWTRYAKGETSVVRFADGTSVGVDLSGRSGAAVMLVSSGEAQGERVRVGQHTLTFRFLGQALPPTIRVRNQQVWVGKQRLSVTGDGRLVFE